VKRKLIIVVKFLEARSKYLNVKLSCIKCEERVTFIFNCGKVPGTYSATS
jgi:hypothetical protein